MNRSARPLLALFVVALVALLLLTLRFKLRVAVAGGRYLVAVLALVLLVAWLAGVGRRR